jgi:hypothetical protein
MSRCGKVLTILVAVYLAGYLAVRLTHKKVWFDKTTEETGSYTFFNTAAPSDSLLYRAFYPLLWFDSEVFQRPFVRDKW